MMALPSTNVIVGVYREPTLEANPDEPEILFIKYHYQKVNRKYIHKKIPGGGKQRAESIREAGVRELKVETGLRPLDKALMPEIRLGESSREGVIHTKYGLLVRRSDCNGRLHKSPVVENKTIIVGYEWLPLSAAMQLMQPTPSTRDRSQYRFLLEVRNILVRKNECPAPTSPEVTV